MKKNQWLLLALAALAWFNAGTVWLIQFSCYPLWPAVGRAAFAAYFQFWQQSTRSVVVLPFALTAAGSLLLLIMARSEFPRWTLWLGLALQMAVEFVRSFLLSPLERHVALLSGQPDAPAYRQLFAANWLLICFVTAYAMFALWMLWRTLSLPSSIDRGRRLLFATSAMGLYAVGHS